MGKMIAVVGATESAGRELLNVLAEQGTPATDIRALTVGEAAGREVSYGEDDVLGVASAQTFDYSTCAIALLAVGAAHAAKLAPRITGAGCAVIDTSEAFRLDDAVPLVIPQINSAALTGWDKKRIVACPSAMTTLIALALAPLEDPFGLVRVVASTYQSTAGTGRDGMDELFRQTRGIYVNEPPASSRKLFTKQIAFNVIPHVDDIRKDGSTDQEAGIAAETRRLFSDDLRVHANCARVPVFVGSAAYINVQTEAPVTADQARAVLKAGAGVSVVDHRADEGYVSPVECSGEDTVFISRVRRDDSVDTGLSFWVVGDDLRTGALTAVATAQDLLALMKG